MILLCVFLKLFINEIFIVLFKTNKNPDENPDLPWILKISTANLKV